MCSFRKTFLKKITSTPICLSKIKIVVSYLKWVGVGAITMVSPRVASTLNSRAISPGTYFLLKETYLKKQVSTPLELKGMLGLGSGACL